MNPEAFSCVAESSSLGMARYARLEFGSPSLPESTSALAGPRSSRYNNSADKLRRRQLGLGKFNMWDTLGFSKSPYDAAPLKAVEGDVDLLIGRGEELVRFQTIIELARNGTVRSSGLPGVGKTSFFNVQQFLMESGQSSFGRKLMAARNLCPIQAEDEVHDIAVRKSLHNMCMSINEYARLSSLAGPWTQALNAFNWLSGKKGSGFDFSLQSPFRNQGGTYDVGGWLVGEHVIPGGCSKPVWRPHVEPDQPPAA